MPRRSRRRRAFETARDAVGFLRHTRSPAALMRVLRPEPPRVLNAVASKEPWPATALATRLRTLGHALALAAVEGVPTSQAVAPIEEAARALWHVTPNELQDDATRIAFFLNLYNVLVLHGAAALGVRSSVLEEPSFFSAIAYRVGDAILTPDRIEHGLLRKNAVHLGHRTLPSSDPAHAFAPSRVEPRIHAALVCASESCPPIAFYEPTRLDAQLDLAMRHFVNAQVRVEGRRAHLPLVFGHYAADFGGEEGAFELVRAHAEPPLAAALGGARTIVYDPWDWRFAVRLAT